LAGGLIWDPVHWARVKQSSEKLCLMLEGASIKGRVAFGGPLTKQQQLVFEIADMDPDLEAARTFVLRRGGARC